MNTMRMVGAKWLIVYSALVASSGLTGQALAEVVSGKYLNPIQVGLLSWYGGSQPNNIGVGSLPTAVAFDGANLWVTNANDSTVTKVRASDGTVLGTFNTGSAPSGVAFDGGNIWVANGGGGFGTTVTKLRASDGSTLGTFSVGHYPSAAAFDGANIWVTNYGDGTVTRLRASDGACVATCTFGVGLAPLGVAFDGASIWVANSAD